MSPLKNVALLGASGNLGLPTLKALLDSDKFNVTVLSRKTSMATFPAGVRVIRVDFTSEEDLTAALTGQDAVVSISTPASSLADQKRVIDSAIAVGVRRFIPSDFGGDLHNPNVAALPLFGDKIAIHSYLDEKVASVPSFSWTTIYTGPFLDWGLHSGLVFKLNPYKPTIYNDGTFIFSATTLASVGQAVVGVLSHPKETANRPVYVEDMKLTQNEILDIAKRLSPGKTWEVVHEDVVHNSEIAWEQVRKEGATQATWPLFLSRVLFGEGYGGNFEKLDNELLGIKGKTEADLEGYVKIALDMAG